MTAVESSTHLDGANRLIAGKRLRAFGIPAAILAYLVYVFISFDVAGVASRARMDNAAILLQDFWSHKVHVTRDNRSGGQTVAIEGSRKATYPADAPPDWVQGEHVVLRDGNSVDLGAVVRVNIAGYGTLAITPAESGITLDAPGPLPEGVSASDARVSVSLPGARVTVLKSRSEVFRYFPGWELFFFSLDSPYHGKSFLTLSGMALTQSGALSGMAHDFWTNPIWHHGEVFWALLETVLMAFLGTIGAALIALPLAFLAARGFSPGWLARQSVRRLFDFLRGVDGLIWTIILSRAFGPGPLTGSLAILLTDTGSFGKLFSEALENTDKKQIEGLQSTGANAILRNRWGVIPQVAPVILSQVLYFLESNTRSATVIGALVGGGIGLMLTQAIATQKDWEHVTYYIILIVLLVMLMDWLSGLIRRRLIKG